MTALAVMHKKHVQGKQALTGNAKMRSILRYQGIIGYQRKK